MRVSGLFVYPVKSGAAVAVDDWPLVGRDGPRPGVHGRGRRRHVPDPARGPGTGTGPARARRTVRVSTALGDAHGRPTPTCGRSACGSTPDPRSTAGMGSRHCSVTSWSARAGWSGLPPTTIDPPNWGAVRWASPTAIRCCSTSESSLADLNARLPTALPMDRFRPNVVIEGAEAFAEDTWATIQLGSVRVDVVKPCATLCDHARRSGDRAAWGR